MIKNKKIIFFCIAMIVMALAFVLGKYFVQNDKLVERQNTADDNLAPFVREHSPSMGPINAKVTVVEFLDPECESCRRFSPIMKQIMKDYEGQIRLVIRYIPFHGNSRFAISILEAARKQNKFWEALELLFKYQPLWGDHHHPAPDKIWEYLPQISGLNIEMVRDDIHDPSISNIILIDSSDAKKLKVRGTPTFFINQKLLQEFSEAGLRQAIKDQI